MRDSSGSPACSRDAAGLRHTEAGAGPPPAGGAGCGAARALIIAGPTAVGKSALGLALARRAPVEIVAADSMQVYRTLDVGTAKPTPEERARVPHHLVDVREPWEDFSAAEFAEAAGQAVREIHARGRLPILLGGTGLYLRAFLKGRLSAGAGDPAVRATLRAAAAAEGPEALHARLQVVDPASAARIHPRDALRLVRALEIHALTGRPPSALRPALWDPPETPVAGFLVLVRDRQEQAARIDARCRAMWGGGLLAETRRLLEAPRGLSWRRLAAVGYRQAREFLEGRQSEAEALTAMQRATRAYAKRQLTWFRREPAAILVAVEGEAWAAPLADEIVRRVRAAGARGVDWGGLGGIRERAARAEPGRPPRPDTGGDPAGG